MEEKNEKKMEEDKIRALADAANAISSGKLDTKIDLDLYGHLGDVAKSIDNIRKNLLTLSSSIGDSSGQVPNAIDHISDVTAQSEKATLDIFKNVEQVQDNNDHLEKFVLQIRKEIVKGTIDLEEMDKVFNKMENTLTENRDCLMNVVAGLSYTDVGGQKLKKARTMVHDLEKKLLELIVIFGFDKKQEEGKEKSQDMLDKLQNAPPAAALNQSLVDDILGEFGFLDT